MESLRKRAFRYNYVGDLIERLMKKNEAPLQVELHPGSNCGPFKCEYCYGKGQVLAEGSLSISDYSQLLDDIIDKRPFIQISGIRSDPLSYPFFYELVKLIKENGFEFGIHTKGYFFNDRIIKSLNNEPRKECFITVSVDSAAMGTYNELHGLSLNNKTYDKIKKNIICLYNEKIKRQSKLRINISYLLFKNNSSVEQINKFIKTFREYADVIRFSIPQVPNTAEPENYLDDEEIDEVFELLKDYENDNIVLLNFKKSKHDEDIRFCWAQRFNSTIDKAGNVFPCPQTALKDYAHLKYGNIIESRFWDVWNSERRKKMLNMSIDDMKCRVCDRKDEAINIELNKMLWVDRFTI